MSDEFDGTEDLADAFRCGRVKEDERETCRTKRLDKWARRYYDTEGRSDGGEDDR